MNDVEQKQCAGYMYAAGSMIQDIAALVGKTTVTVSTWLGKMGVVKRPKFRVDAWSDEEQKRLIARYIAGESLAVLSDEIGCKRQNLAKWLRVRGVSVRQKREATTLACSLSVNHAAFSVLSPEAAYWAGVIMTDGCVSIKKKGAPIVKLALAERDINLVNKFKRFIAAEQRIICGDNGPGKRKASVTVTSLRMAEDLAAINIIPNKTTVAATPAILFNNRDYHRGCVDGDGHVSFYERYGRPHACIGLCGARGVVEPFMQYCKNNGCCAVECKVDAKQIKNMEFCRFAVSGKGAAYLAYLLYESAKPECVLDRKAATAAKIIDWGRKTFGDRLYQDGPAGALKICKCEKCGLAFDATAKHQRYCSPECASVAHVEAKRRGKRIEMEKIHAQLDAAFSEQNPGQSRTEGECPICGSKFSRGHAGHKYCSEECRHQSIILRDRARNTRRKKSEK